MYTTYLSYQILKNFSVSKLNYCLPLFNYTVDYHRQYKTYKTEANGSCFQRRVNIKTSVPKQSWWGLICLGGFCPQKHFLDQHSCSEVLHEYQARVAKFTPSAPLHSSYATLNIHHVSWSPTHFAPHWSTLHICSLLMVHWADAMRSGVISNTDWKVHLCHKTPANEVLSLHVLQEVWRSIMCDFSSHVF